MTLLYISKRVIVTDADFVYTFKKLLKVGLTRKCVHVTINCSLLVCASVCQMQTIISGHDGILLYLTYYVMFI